MSGNPLEGPFRDFPETVTFGDRRDPDQGGLSCRMRRKLGFEELPPKTDQRCPEKEIED
jgi:hypothetical protein